MDSSHKDFMAIVEILDLKPWEQKEYPGVEDHAEYIDQKMIDNSYMRRMFPDDILLAMEEKQLYREEDQSFSVWETVAGLERPTLPEEY